jgi:hypothetical protein
MDALRAAPVHAHCIACLTAPGGARPDHAAGGAAPVASFRLSATSCTTGGGDGGVFVAMCTHELRVVERAWGRVCSVLRRQKVWMFSALSNIENARQYAMTSSPRSNIASACRVCVHWAIPSGVCRRRPRPAPLSPWSVPSQQQHATNDRAARRRQPGHSVCARSGARPPRLPCTHARRVRSLPPPRPVQRPPPPHTRLAVKRRQTSVTPKARASPAVGGAHTCMRSTSTHVTGRQRSSTSPTRQVECHHVHAVH